MRDSEKLLISYIAFGIFLDVLMNDGKITFNLMQLAIDYDKKREKDKT